MKYYWLFQPGPQVIVHVQNCAAAMNAEEGLETRLTKSMSYLPIYCHMKNGLDIFVLLCYIENCLE